MLFNLDFVSLILLIPGVLLAFTVHEFGHAIVADWFGDPTPRLTGRLTLEPWKHIDPIGALLLLLVGFGWAKPVMTNPSRYRHRTYGTLAVSIAGVTMNFLTATLFQIILTLGYALQWFSPFDPVFRLLNGVVLMNLGLAAFNLLPIPPLDGYRFLAALTRGSLYNVLRTIEQYSFLLFFLIIATPVSNYLLYPIRAFFIWAISGITRLVVGPFLGL